MTTTSRKTIRQMLDDLGYASGDHDEDVRLALAVLASQTKQIQGLLEDMEFLKDKVRHLSNPKSWF